MHLLQLLPRFRQIELSLRDYEARETWPAGDVAQYQLERINTLWRYARQNVPYYRDLPGPLPDSFRSLEEYTGHVPLLPKQRVRDSPRHFLSGSPAPGSWHRTGGSTGTPMGVYWEHTSHREMLRGKYRSEQAHGLNVFDRKIFLWGHSGSFEQGWRGRVQKWLRPIQDGLRNRKRISAYDLSPQSLTLRLREIRDYAPRSLYGYSSAVSLLANAAAEAGIDLPNLTTAIMTAEPADVAMRAEVRQKLGCVAVLEYGAVECGLLAYLMPDETLRTRDDLVHCETLPNENGSYDLVITVLTNRSFPLLRYCIEDSTSAPRRQPEVGFGVLADVLGRSNDLLLGKQGRILHPMAIKHVLEHWPEIRRFTAHQRVSGELALTIEAPEALSPALLSTVKSVVEGLLEGFPVQTKTVSEIQGSLAGKHRWIVSDLMSNRRRTDAE